jgi:hypothetical protein
MHNYEFFASRLEQEIPAFLKVFRAMPADQLHYRPHEKCTPAGALAWQMAREVDSLVQLLDTGVIDYKSDEPGSVDDIVALFERGAKGTVERARSTSDARWEGPARFLYDGNLAWETKVSDMAWGFLFDLVHHRGQLSAYLRPMGGKVPAIYGPSADDPGGA